MKPTYGLFSLTIEGAKRLFTSRKSSKLWVQVQDEAIPFITKGRNVFAKNVTIVDLEIRPKEEVIVIDGCDRVIAVGRAVLSGNEMLDFSKGIAVKIRGGKSKKTKRTK